MLKRFENRLMGCSTLLSTRDKLILIKYVFSSMPIFFMCSLSIPVTVVNQLNIFLKNCFWREYGTKDSGTTLISWDKVCLPKTHGGLVVHDIHTNNQALLMKYLHKFMNKTFHGYISSGKLITLTLCLVRDLWVPSGGKQS